MTDGLPMTIHEQDVEMRRDWPSFRRLLFDPIEERVAWRGTLHPRINRYTVEIDYSMDWVIRGPKVRVIAPVLTRLPENPEGDLPHVYDRKRDPSLCLFDPRRREWTASGATRIRRG